MKKDVKERLKEKSTVLPSGCVQWNVLDKKGYGTITILNVRKKAHRVAWEIQNGPIPEGLVVDHLCRNRGCINPDHMELVTPGENTLRGFSFSAVYARKTHCIRGHELPKEKNRRFQRQCVICKRKAFSLERAKNYAAKMSAVEC